jgi:ectoine hydroxylase
MTTATASDLYPSRVAAGLLERRDPVVWGKPDDGPLSLLHLRLYEQKGFLVFEGMFPADELALFQQELARLRTDPSVKDRPDVITEPGSGEVRSVFAVHQNNEILSQLTRDQRVVAIARQLLGGDVYIHQSRVSYKSGFTEKELYWHSDFETWHVEDGMPRMRAVSCSISLTDNNPNNGPLMLIPGSHRRPRLRRRAARAGLSVDAGTR